MSVAIPDFRWIGLDGMALQAIGGMTMTQVELLSVRVEDVSDKQDALAGKVDNLTKEMHLASLATAALAGSVANLEEINKKQSKLLEEISDDRKFWMRLRKILWGFAAFIAAYATGWIDFIRNYLK